MRKILVCSLGLFLLASSTAAQQNTPAKQRPVVFTHVTVIDVTGGPPQSDRTVVILSGHIAEIGDSARTAVPKHSQVVDATGKFLIPGLWDMHVHWYLKEYLPLFIANGVTGVRLMWGNPDHHEWRTQIENGSLLGPHMVISSPIVDGPKPYWPGSVAVASESEGRQAVIRAKQDGADFVKVYSFLPREAYFSIADEAKKQGIPFEGHVPIAVTVEEASKAGQKTMEHLYGILPACSIREEDLLKSSQDALTGTLASSQPISALPGRRERNQLALDTYSQEKAGAVFAELKDNHTWQCPTLTVLRSTAFPGDPSQTSDPRLKYMPRQIVSSWDPSTDFRFKNRTPEEIELGKKVYRKNLEIVGAMQRAGVGILAGTDTLNPYCFPGFSLHDELALLVQAGLTPMQALQAATLSPARFLGRENEFGTIEKGKVADLALLEANPLEDIRNTTKIAAVVYQGKLLPKSSIDAMLANAEALASRKSIAEALLKTINEKDVESAVKQYHELRTAQPDTYDFSESELIGLGYQLLGSKQVNAAIAIFQLNAESYPESYNAYDSLGEAYMVNGEKELARKNYRKSLELNSKNTNAAEMLKKLADE